MKLKKESLLKDSEIKNEQNFRHFLFGVIALVILLVVLAYIAYRNKKKDNKVLEVQKTQITIQKKEITNSINYAQKIQSSLLPSR